MKKKYLVAVFLSCFSMICLAHAENTKRIQQVENAEVKVWKTIIYPGHEQTISMHRHDRDRVVVALSDGTLKVITDKGDTRYLHFKKNKAYFLTKDVPNELHSDENISDHPIKVMVIELKP